MSYECNNVKYCFSFIMQLSLVYCYQVYENDNLKIIIVRLFFTKVEKYMKFLTWILGLIIVVVVLVYVVAFTSVGNGLLQPTIESKIKEQTKLNSKLEVFSLSMSEFEILLALNDSNTVHIKGKYSLFSQVFNIVYDVKLEKLNTLKALTSQKLNGSFHTDGVVNGDMAFLTVEGKSDVGNSDTVYHVELTDMNPTSIIAKIKDAKLESFLHMGGQKQYASAIINLDVNFKNIEVHKLDGDIKLTTKNGEINSKLMLNDFNVSIPKTSFAMNLDAKLKNDDVNYAYNLSSNLFKILSSGHVIPEPLKTDIKYSLNVKELGVLKPITGADIRGSLNLNGTVVGTKSNMVVNAKSDLADSDTTIKAVLKDFKASSVIASIKNLKLQKLLYMVKQPHYTDGVFSLDAKLTNLEVGKLKGNIVTKIQNGLLDSRYITKAYEFKSAMPRTTYNLRADTSLNADLLDTKLDFNSNIANLDVKSAKFNIKDSSLNTDYLTKISNLDKLFFVTDQHMKGSIVANGEVNKAKDLDLTFHTKVASGNIDAKLHNDDFKATLKGVQTLGLLHMLIYPEVFKSTLNADVDYNLAESKGRVNGHLVDGTFTRNQLFTLVRQYGKLDLYRENFSGDVSATINKEKVVASLDLKSRQASIITKNTKLNTKTQIIDSKVNLKIKKNEIGAKITGNINNPKVKLDVNDMVKKEAEKGIKKLFKKFF